MSQRRKTADEDEILPTRLNRSQMMTKCHPPLLMMKETWKFAAHPTRNLLEAIDNVNMELTTKIIISEWPT